MSETLTWWVMVQVVGLAALPLCLTLFRRLPDRGYALSKPFALLITGYLFWILVIIGLPNVTVSIGWVLGLIAAASAYVVWRRRDELLDFVLEHWRLIVATEVLFFLAFITAAYLRSFVPAINDTEKPMDFMFLNALSNADSFPPEDPWLAGENVAYYYFGYLLISIMTRLSGVATSIGYNLGLAMIVAMSVTAAFGLVYDLASSRRERTPKPKPQPKTDVAGGVFSSRLPWRPMAFGLVAALLLTVMGNMEGLLEWLAAHNIGSEGFWSWVNITDGGRTLVGYESAKWYPDQHIFWWLSTRIIQVNEGTFGIHEFPFFSFLLGDLHPHVMSIPFVLLALGAALALLRSEGPLDIVFWLERPFWLLALALILGGLAFFNTWDMPTIALVVVLVAFLRNRLLAGRWSWGLSLDTLGFVAPLFLVSFLAYTPFFFGGFDSQASGFKADSTQGTPLFHALLLWGPFAVLVLPYAIWRLSRSGQRITAAALLVALAPALLIVAAWLAWDALAVLGGWLPAGVQLSDIEPSFWTRITERGWNWLTVVVMGGSLGLLVLALAREVDSARGDEDRRVSHVFALALSATAALLILGAEFFFIRDFFNSRMNTVFKLYYQAWLLLSIAGGFALYAITRDWKLPALDRARLPKFEATLENWSLGELMIAVATAAGGITGVILMHDTVFGLRVVGALIGAGLLLAASATVVLLWRSAVRGLGEGGATKGAVTWRAPWAGLAGALLVAAFVYPLLATYNRTNDFENPRTLDGLEYLRTGAADEYEVIEWLSEQDGRAVVAEAPGKGYQVHTSRVSGITGLPTVLGWQGHEEQWRGADSVEETNPRHEDLDKLYTSTDQDEVKSVIEKYGIVFVFVGNAERQEYPNLSISEMTEVLDLAFERGDVKVYRVKPSVLYEGNRE